MVAQSFLLDARRQKDAWHSPCCRLLKNHLLVLACCCSCVLTYNELFYREFRCSALETLLPLPVSRSHRSIGTTNNAISLLITRRCNNACNNSDATARARMHFISTTCADVLAKSLAYNTRYTIWQYDSMAYLC